MTPLEQIYRDYAAETIYLIPDSDEGRLIYLWSDDPAPSEHHVRDEAVEYIRKDIHDAHSDMLENRGDELQMMMADVEKECDAALERDQALAAHVDLLSDLLEQASEIIGRDTVAGQQWHDAECKALQHEPVNTLARRDLIKQAEALEEMAVALKQWDYADAAQAARIRAHVLRQQAAAL